MSSRVETGYSQRLVTPANLPWSIQVSQTSPFYDYLNIYHTSNSRSRRNLPPLIFQSWKNAHGTNDLAWDVFRISYSLCLYLLVISGLRLIDYDLHAQVRFIVTSSYHLLFLLIFACNFGLGICQGPVRYKIPAESCQLEYRYWEILLQFYTSVNNTSNLSSCAGKFLRALMRLNLAIYLAHLASFVVHASLFFIFVSIVEY